MEDKKRKTGLTNYAVAVNWLHKGVVLCNNIAKIDPSVFENMRKELEDEGTGEYTEIYQWFITGFNDDDIDWLEKTFPDLIFTYSEMLGTYILCVNHLGTGWDYVWTTCTNQVCERALGEEI